MIDLYQRVIIKRDIPEASLKVGDIAWLVDYVPHPKGGEDGCVLEIYNRLGDSVAVVTVPASAIEPLHQNPSVKRSGSRGTEKTLIHSHQQRREQNSILVKPGEVVNHPGQYEERGPRGGKLNDPRQVTIEPGDKPLPPTSKPGNKWKRIGPPKKS